MNRNNIILIIVLLTLLSFGSYFGAQFLYRIDKTELNMSVSPANANVSVNARAVNVDGIYLKPGKYMVSAILDGYYEYRKIYEVTEQKGELSIKMKQKPTQTILSMLYSPGSQKKAIDKYPIIKKLPYTTFLVKLSVAPESTIDSFAIDITAYEGYRQSAIEKIKFWKYNPADYNIKFKNYENPFKL